MHFDEVNDSDDQNVVQTPDGPMIQMAKMHGTFHVHERVISFVFLLSKKFFFFFQEHTHPEPSIRIPVNFGTFLVKYFFLSLDKCGSY